jgi:hypothetical protein
VKEIWEQALLSYNLPLTVLLGLTLLFWVVSLLGVGDLDPEMDADVDVDVGGDLPSVGAFGFLLRVVNAHDIPLMLVLSLLSLFMWSLAIISNFYFNQDQSAGRAVLFFAGNFFVSVLLVKVVTQPMRSFFRSLKNDQEHQEPLIGASGTVKSRVLDEEFGQCEVVRPKGAPALLNCRLAEGEDALGRGSKILIIDYDETARRFIAKTD